MLLDELWKCFDVCWTDDDNYYEMLYYVGSKIYFSCVISACYVLCMMVIDLVYYCYVVYYFSLLVFGKLTLAFL